MWLCVSSSQTVLLVRSYLQSFLISIPNTSRAVAKSLKSFGAGVGTAFAARHGRLSKRRILGLVAWAQLANSVDLPGFAVGASSVNAVFCGTGMLENALRPVRSVKTNLSYRIEDCLSDAGTVGLVMKGKEIPADAVSAKPAVTYLQLWAQNWES